MICRHCHNPKKGIDRRGLCRPCYRDPDVRAQYAVIPTTNCGLALSNAKLPMPNTPTDAQPGSEEKVAILEARAAAGEQLWHPKDRDGSRVPIC